MRVIIVDDSLADRKLYRILLEGKYGRNLEVIEAATGAEGLAACLHPAATTSQPECVLLDYKLPDMNGLEFLRALFQRSPEHRLAVIMLTGIGNERIAAEAIKTGAQDYLVKDRITSESLQAAVENSLEKISLIDALKADRDRLARSLEEKEVLLREVHHRVKNNLQVIASLLRLQAERLEASSPERRPADVLRDTQHRVESMALIHEQLYAAPPCSGGNLREVDMAAFASALAANLSRAYGIDPSRIGCRVNVEPIVEPVDRAIPAGLILNELLSNAYKHAFPANRGGDVRIEGRVSGNHIEFVVGDDGAGIPEGTSADGSKTLGFEIVRILGRQLGGSIEVERNNGTVCRLRYPRAHASVTASGGAK